MDKMNRQTNPSSSSSSSSQSELLCRVKYLNNLPDIPFDPKFIAYPFDPTRFIKYNSTTLEKNFKWDILHEQDLGIRIDLINPDKSETNALLDEADEKLLEEETINAADAKRSEQHNKSVAWLRRNEYISTENTRFQPKVYDQAESKIGYGSIKRKLSENYFYKDRESQIKSIEKSFEAAKQPIEKHFSKQGVFPLQVLPLFPDFDLWKNSFSQVLFDTDPATKGKGAQVEEMSQAMIRGMIDENGDQFVAYFLPNEETLAKRKRDDQNINEIDPDEEYNYKLIREYTWSVKTNTGYEENYNIIFRDNAVYYNPLATRVRLNKRRSKGGKVSNTRLIIKYRNHNKDELKQQKNRMKQVDNKEGDDEEDDDEDEDENKNVHTESHEESNDGHGEEEEEDNHNHNQNSNDSNQEAAHEQEEEEEEEEEESSNDDSD